MTCLNRNPKQGDSVRFLMMPTADEIREWEYHSNALCNLLRNAHDCKELDLSENNPHVLYTVETSTFNGKLLQAALDGLSNCLSKKEFSPKDLETTNKLIQFIKEYFHTCPIKVSIE